MKSPFSLLFFLTNQPQFLQLLFICLSFYAIHCLHCSFFIALAHALVTWYPYCCDWPKTEHSTWNQVLPVSNTEWQTFLESCWPHYFWCRPGCHWCPWPLGHADGSCSAGCWVTPPVPFLLDSFTDTLSPACTAAWGYYVQTTRGSCQPITVKKPQQQPRPSAFGHSPLKLAISSRNPLGVCALLSSLLLTKDIKQN